MAYTPTRPDHAGTTPGEARCPGPSTRDIILRDAGGAPDFIVEERNEFLGDEDLPFNRYTDPAFHDAETRRLWNRTWQWACREEHIPATGDYYTYDVSDYSVIIIRDESDHIRAFVNSCPHRGMQFCASGTHGHGKQFLRCPFHGMSWHLDGTLREIPCRWDFPHIKDDTFRLSEVLCDTWGGFVFVNLDRAAPPLNEFLQVLPEHFRDVALEDRYVALHMRKLLPGNWKMCMEGFLEAYHVLATHPEGLRTAGDANAQYDVFGENVTRFVHTIGYPSPHLTNQPSEAELFAALGHDKNDLPAGASARQHHADGLRESLSQQWDVDLSTVSNTIMLDSIEYHLFPNACFFPGMTIPLIYRFRPAGYDKCLHDIMLLRPIPERGPRPAPAEVIELGIEDSYTSVKEFAATGLAHVLDQDTDNFHRQWAGMKTSQKAGQSLGNYQESRIRRFHLTLDAYLNRR